MCECTLQKGNLVRFEPELVCNDILQKFNIVTLYKYIYLEEVVNRYHCGIAMAELSETFIRRVEMLNLFIS